LEEPILDLVKQLLREILTSRRGGLSVEPTIELQLEEWPFEQLLPQQSKQVPDPETLALILQKGAIKACTRPVPSLSLFDITQESTSANLHSLYYPYYEPHRDHLSVAVTNTTAALFFVRKLIGEILYDLIIHTPAVVSPGESIVKELTTTDPPRALVA
jgi:hypothetical protein